MESYDDVELFASIHFKLDSSYDDNSIELRLVGRTFGCGCCSWDEEVRQAPNMVHVLQGNAKMLRAEADRLDQMVLVIQSYGYTACKRAMQVGRQLASLLRGELVSGEQLAEASELYSQLGTKERHILEALDQCTLESIAKASWTVGKDWKE
jgi:hypothetical protein